MDLLKKQADVRNAKVEVETATKRASSKLKHSLTKVNMVQGD